VCPFFILLFLLFLLHLLCILYELEREFWKRGIEVHAL
jgi:hypothetical protein